MTEYRRLKLQNYPVFITIVAFNRNPILIKNINLLRESFKAAIQKHEFEIFASVILHDHMHLIFNMSETTDYSSIISSIKSYFSMRINEDELLPVKDKITQSKVNKREKGVWQRRFYEHTIRDEYDLHNHLDYIHYNPVKHGLVKKVKDWEFSSFNKFLRQKLYEENWGSIDDIKELSQLKISQFD